MKKIYIYWTGDETGTFSEMEYAESPTREDDTMKVYATLSSDDIIHIYEEYMKLLEWRKNADGSPAIDGCSRSPQSMADDLLEVAIHRSSSPFTFVVSKDYDTGAADTIIRPNTDSPHSKPPALQSRLPHNPFRQPFCLASL